MPGKSPQRIGIETQTRGDGSERHRAYLRFPSPTGQGRGPLKRGPWREHLAEARQDRLSLQNRAAQGAPAPSAMPTVSEAASAFLRDAEQGRTWARGGKRYAARSLAIYDQDFRLRIVPALGTLPVDQVRRSQVQALVSEVAVLSSPQRARMVVGALGALYRYLMERYDELEVPPTVRLNLPAPTPPRERVLMPDEMTAALDALDKRTDRTFFALCGLAGLRRQEAAQLVLGDVDLDARRLRVRGTKSAASDRVVPIFDALGVELEGQVETLGPDADHRRVLLPRMGRHGRMVGRNVPLDVDEALERARLVWPDVLDDYAEVVPHTFRHSFASYLVAGGYDVATVSEWVGHGRISTTLDVYVKPMRSRGLTPEAVEGYLGAYPWGDGYPARYPTAPKTP